MQSDLEREMSRQLSLMQHKAVDPWPAFETEFRFDARCCPHLERAHRDGHCRTCEVNCLSDYQQGRTEDCYCAHDWHKGRMWRADVAYLAPYNLLIEVDGAVYTAGRHTRGKGWEEDARKQARAVELGYRVLRFSGGQVKSGEALNVIGACLGVGNG